VVRGRVTSIAPMPDKQYRIYPPILARARELRQPQTRAEAILWMCLRNQQLCGFKFRRQHPIDRFIVDFYCAGCRLIVEVDGNSHLQQIEYDEARTQWLNDSGYRVVRFTNQEVYGNLDAILEAILTECQRLSAPSP
jgi:very-short-patch-repair endonuclease